MAYEYEDLQELLSGRELIDLRRKLLDMNSADIAEFLETVPQNKLVIVFRMLPKEMAAEAFAYLEVEDQEKIINLITDKELSYIMEELFVDDAVDMLEELPANVVKRVMKSAGPETRDLINHFLKYPENSAGSIMTAEFIDLKKYMNVSQAFERIRKTGEDKETIYTCYVVNENRQLEGVVTVKTLLLSDVDKKISDIMDTNVISAITTDDQEQVSDLFSRYDLLAVPVVDTENRLVGIITVDDIIDVIERETTEDFEKMAAITPSERPYIKTGVFTLARNRVLWLLILMISGTLTGSILLHYQSAYAVAPLLIAMIPMLSNTGGNAGSQSSTLIIRAMALGDIRTGDILKVFWKEIRVSVLVGIVLAAVNFVRIILFYPDSEMLALVVSLSLVATVMLAKAIGCTLPILARVFRLDPAIMSAPLITTAVDAGSLLIYFSIAGAILRL